VRIIVKGGTMKTKSHVIMLLTLSFSLSLFSAITIRAQQEDDDPNWRERTLEKFERTLEQLKKAQMEIEKLKKENEENRRESQRMRMELERAILRSSNRPGSVPKSRFLDIYDYRPISEIRKRI
jgi:hypothetical protein